MKQMLISFILAGILMCSCGGGPTTKEKTNGDSIKAKTYRTVQSVDSLRAGDTVLIELNGIKYEVTSVESPAEQEATPPQGSSKTMMAVKKNKACDSDFFDGNDRKAAKISISSGTIKDYNTLADFILSLPPDADMGALNIPTGATSNRVTKEKHNVHVLKAYIYAYARETDEDFHVILGTTDQGNTAKFFNMEISGLPPVSSSAYAKLKAVRDAFTTNFKITGCPTDYKIFSKKPVPVEVTGSIFFDVVHYNSSATIGPAPYHPTSYWEIHPVTAIKF